MTGHGREKEQEHLPFDSKEIAKEGEKNRKEMNKAPEHGTDPLYEGP